jgi:hypothetical protein
MPQRFGLASQPDDISVPHRRPQPTEHPLMTLPGSPSGTVDEPMLSLVVGAADQRIRPFLGRP